MNKKKIATQTFKDYPEANEAHITQDGQAFFTKVSAQNHSTRMGFDEEPELFFRDGFEPEDTKGIQEELSLVKIENETLTGILAIVEEATDLTKVAPEVDQETDSAIAAVVQLREKFIASDILLERIGKATDYTNEIPEVTNETTDIEKAVISLRQEVKATRDQLALSNEALEALKAEKITVVDSKEVKTEATASSKK